MKNMYFKVLVISVLCLLLNSCKSQSNVIKKEKIEREDTTDDVRNEQMDDYEEDMKQQYEENNQDR
jgi:hypothetical protein